MNVEEEEEEDLDELLSPMVDGLSGALCLLVLVATVFMISALNKIHKGDGETQFKNSVVLINEKKIYFWGLISLTDRDVLEIKRSVPSNVNGKKLVFRVYINSKTLRYKQIYTANVIRLNQLIRFYDETPMFKEGAEIKCGGSRDCIYWEYE